MKSSKVKLNMYQVNQFAVFGFNSNYQTVEESVIYVRINYSILTGALLCLQCDIFIKQSELQFIANGLQLSALILKSKDIIQIENVTVSYRFSCNSSSGIANQIMYDVKIFQISNLILTGYNDIVSSLNGYFSSKVDVDVSIQLNTMKVCVDIVTQRVGQTLNIVKLSSVELLQCTQVCNENLYVMYGLCQEIVSFSTLLSNNTVICEYPFEYDSVSNSCVCSYGYYLNVTVCVHIISQLSLITTNMLLYDSNIQLQIINSQIELNSTIYNFELEIQANISNLSELVLGSYADLKQNIITTNELITDITQQFRFVLDQNIATQTTIDSLKSEISSNFSVITTLMNKYQQDVNNNLTVTTSKIINLNTVMQASFDQVITDVKNTNMNINNNFSQTNQNINSINAKMNAVVTNSMFQTQIDQLKQQIQNISVSISNSITSNQFQCLMMAAWEGTYFSMKEPTNDGIIEYINYMAQYNCQVKKWW
ncbi:Hypothetical_protein [Hexamita inflata]|uniref:Hypothetical_protein n=1 Tax=Hexamita inflata TaxID=28002 RepID=A0ABP1GSM6_9EUKA